MALPASNQDTATQGNSRYKDGPFDQIEGPALASFVLCLLGLFLFLTWVRSLDGRHFETPEENGGGVDRVAKILMPPKMAFIQEPEAIPRPMQTAVPSRPKPAPVDPTAQARITRSKIAVVERIESVQQKVKKAGVLAILSATGGGKSGFGGDGLGSRLKMSGLGNLGKKLDGLQGLTRYEDTRRTEAGSDPKTAGVDKLIKGFDNAKTSSLTKIGSLDLGKTERVNHDRRYANARNTQELHAVISRKQTAIRILYEERLRTRPNLEGKITLLLVIEEDGTVSDVTVIGEETTLDDADLIRDCIRVARRWVFPAFTGGAVELKTPFVLKPR